MQRRLEALAAAGLTDEGPAAIAARVQVLDDLGASLASTCYVQECAPENLELKQALFEDLGRLAPDDAVFASSSSALSASHIAGGLPCRDRCLVAHPGNPPYLLPVVELVPAPFTAPSAVDMAEALLGEVGMSPVRVQREVEGFVFNRLQGAVLREAYCLVRDGVATPEDIDRVMRDGPGRRWSILGPFEVAELNTRGGIDAHARLLGPAYARMGAERGQSDPWTRRTGGHRLQSGAGALSPGRLGRKRRMAGPCPDGTGGLPPGQPGAWPTLRLQALANGRPHRPPAGHDAGHGASARLALRAEAAPR